MEEKESDKSSFRSLGATNVGESACRIAHIVRLADVEKEEVKWLWSGRVPLGKVTILEGDPGLGKSTLLLAVAATVTTGAALPESQPVEVGSVLIVACEDGVADTIKPRFAAVGGDESRCFVLVAMLQGDSAGEPTRDILSLPQDIPILKHTIEEYGVSLVIIDPLFAYINGKIDSHKDQQIRKVMTPLTTLAEESGASIVVIRHLNKGQNASALYRGGGSIAIAGAVRSVLYVGIHPTDSDLRVLASTKSNLGKSPSSLCFKIAERDGIGYVQWVGACEYTADDLVQPTAESGSGNDQADQFLADFLKLGPQLKADVLKAAEKHGVLVGDRTLRRRLIALGGALNVGGKSGVWGFTGLVSMDMAAHLGQSVQPDQSAEDESEEPTPMQQSIGLPGLDGQAGHIRQCGQPGIDGVNQGKELDVPERSVAFPLPARPGDDL